MIRLAFALLLLLAQGSVDPLHPVQLRSTGGSTSIPSPNGAQTLVADDDASRLWMEDTSTHQRRLAMELTLQTATAFWSPDSRYFVVNDRSASGWEDGYLYDAATLKPLLDLRKLLLAADGTARATMQDKNTTHAYVHAITWLDPAHLQVKLNGRLDSHGTPDHIRLGHCFDFRYRVSLTGRVETLSRTTVRVDHDCGDMESYD